MAEAARAILEVTAGLIPGQAEQEFTRRWGITSSEWEAAAHKPGAGMELLVERNGVASAYAAWLMLQPERLNWVRLDWTWL